MRTMQSSNLNTVDYDQMRQQLTVQFVNGAIYVYSGVPFSEYWNLVQSASPGGYFDSKIKNRYTTSKLQGPIKKKR